MTYKQISFNNICSVLNEVAQSVSFVCGFGYTVSDMVYSLADLNDKTLGELKEPYYIAIREQGTESGFKEHCIERCKALGYPIVIAKIEKDEVFDFNMNITFTHGWMDRDNNYMEQEFNSL